MEQDYQKAVREADRAEQTAQVAAIAYNFVKLAMGMVMLVHFAVAGLRYWRGEFTLGELTLWDYAKFFWPWAVTLVAYIVLFYVFYRMRAAMDRQSAVSQARAWDLVKRREPSHERDTDPDGGAVP